MYPIRARVLASCAQKHEIPNRTHFVEAAHIRVYTRTNAAHTHTYVRLKRKEANWQNGRKSTCLKEAGSSLLANLVARPARHRAVIHFRGRRVVQPGPVKQLVLLQAVGDRRRARDRRVRVSRMLHLDQLAGIIECPLITQGGRMALHRAH